MKEFFEKRRFTGTIALTLSNKQKWFKDKAQLCKEIVEVVDRYSRSGYVLTLRQLYYQLVSINAIRNDDVVYKKLSAILDDLRQAGIIDWDAIEDRGRRPQIPYYVEDVADALNDTIRHYRRDRQTGQKNHIEVWTEKDAISGILSRVTNKYHVHLVVNKGYSSNSAMYAAYKRFVAELKEDKDVYILYFGDHDPSGLDMIRDIRERTLHFLASSEHADSFLPEASDPDWGFIEEYFAENDLDYHTLYEDGFLPEKSYTFFEYNVREHEAYDHFLDELYKAARKHYWNTRFHVVPIGLTMEQIHQYNPPENPAKFTDPRSAWYIKQFGQKSWEVDALKPDVMVRLVESGIEERIDMDVYESMLSIERNDIAQLKGFIATLNKDEESDDESDDTE
jgi:hypothetical protein